MTSPLRILVADDERPARTFLVDLLKTCASVELVGEASNGAEAISLIEEVRPQLALLDLQMPETSGLDVVRSLPEALTPLVAFVTAHDDFAVEAFELNAVDYLLKPVQRDRLEATLDRARQRIEQSEPARERVERLSAAASAYERGATRPLERLPVRRGEEVFIVPVRQIASIVADGETLHVTLVSNEQYTITHRLHALESRLSTRRFIRLGRGTLANVDAITRLSPMPGGTFMATLSNGQELPVSRIQSRVLRDTLLKL